MLTELLLLAWIFQRLADVERGRLVGLVRIRLYKPCETIVEKGDPPRQLFVLQDRKRTAARALIDVPLSQQALGDLLGAKPESVIQHITEWTRSRVLKQGCGQIELLDLDALR